MESASSVISNDTRRRQTTRRPEMSMESNIVDLRSDDEDEVVLIASASHIRQSNLIDRSSSVKRRRTEDKPIENLNTSSSSDSGVSFLSLPGNTDPVTATKTALPPLSKGDDMRTRLKQNLTCPVCMEIYYKPVCLVTCSHMLCGACYSEWRKTKDICVVCRNPVSMVLNAPSNVATILEDYLSIYPEDKRNASSIRDCEAKDTVKRKILLKKGEGSYAAATAQVTLNQAIAHFLEITGAPLPIARSFVEDSRRRGESVQHAINRYLEMTPL